MAKMTSDVMVTDSRVTSRNSFENFVTMAKTVQSVSGRNFWQSKAQAAFSSRESWSK